MLSWLFGSSDENEVDPIDGFLAAEETLREQHGVGSLYVRPKRYEGRGEILAVGGWAFLDGDPAILPEGLDVLVITFEQGGEMVTCGRVPGDVHEVLGDRVRREEDPLPHFTARVPEADRDRVLQAIAALPDAV